MRRLPMLVSVVAVLAGCGDDAPKPEKTKAYANDTTGLAMRYPADWDATIDQPAVLIFQRDNTADCTVTVSGGVPPLPTEAARVAYVRRKLEQAVREGGGELKGVEPVRGVNVAGAAGLIRYPKAAATVRSTFFASAGTGVQLACRAASPLFEDADATAFSAMQRSIRLRRDPGTEELHRTLSARPDVREVSVSFQEEGVALQATQRSGRPSRATLDALLDAAQDAYPDRSVGGTLFAADKQDVPLTGRRAARKP